MVKACFLDRDGTINKLISGRPDPKHVGPWYFAEFDYIDGVEEAISIIKQMGFTTHVVTNQPDVDDGLMTEDTLDMMHKALKIDLKVDTIQAARTRNTPEYKPNNGMLENIIKDFNVSRKRSYMIGDSWKDVVAGYRSGLVTIYLGEEYKCPEEYKDIKPDFIANNLLEATNVIKYGEVNND